MPDTNSSGRAVTTDLRRGQVVGDASRRAVNLNTLTKAAAGTTYAPIASPVFTGDPKAPTPAPGDNDTSVATTAFVAAADNLRVLKAGDTMTGPLNITQPSGTGLYLSGAGTGTSLNTQVDNNGTVSNAGTTADLFAILGATPNAYVGVRAQGGATPSASILTGTGLPGGLTISAATGGITLSSPTAVTGTTTNNNAAAGQVGEVISSLVSSGVALPSNIATMIVTISLTAGDWDLAGEAWFFGTVVGNLLAKISSVSGDTGATPALNSSVTLMTNGQAGNVILAMCPLRVSLAATTNMYLNLYQFGASGATGMGKLFARRAR